MYNLDQKYNEIKVNSVSNIYSLAKENNITEMSNRLSEIQLKLNDRILICDDEEFCLVGLKMIMKTLGIDVENKVDLSMSAEETLELIKHASNLGIRYKLIITDI